MYMISINANTYTDHRYILAAALSLQPRQQQGSMKA